MELACGGVQSVDPIRPNKCLGKLNSKMVLTVLRWAMSDRPNEKSRLNESTRIILTDSSKYKTSHPYTNANYKN